MLLICSHPASEHFPTLAKMLILGHSNLCKITLNQYKDYLYGIEIYVDKHVKGFTSFA